MERLSTGKSYCSSFASLNSDGLLSTIDAQVNDKALEFDQDDTMDSEIPDKLGVASFDGSFAPLTRPIVVGVPIPWYRDKKYFTDGWTSLSIWKSAVRDIYQSTSVASLLRNDSSSRRWQPCALCTSRVKSAQLSRPTTPQRQEP